MPNPLSLSLSTTPPTSLMMTPYQRDHPHWSLSRVPSLIGPPPPLQRRSSHTPLEKKTKYGEGGPSPTLKSHGKRHSPHPPPTTPPLPALPTRPIVHPLVQCAGALAPSLAYSPRSLTLRSTLVLRALTTPVTRAPHPPPRSCPTVPHPLSIFVHLPLICVRMTPHRAADTHPRVPTQEPFATLEPPPQLEMAPDSPHLILVGAPYRIIELITPPEK